MRLGVIADDFTGGTDIASFLVKGGMRTVQTSGVPTSNEQLNADAIVVSLKSRSCDSRIAIKDSLDALSWLKQQGCTQFYFKYCSTFDSTSEGNIGPVTDALLSELDQGFTIVCPSLPINGRTVYYGHLFVKGAPLNESGMQNHPVTPMKDSSVVRLMDNQSTGSSGLVDFQTIERGPEAVRSALDELRSQGFRYAVVDAFRDAHLATIAKATDDLPLITGGSGLGLYIARNNTVISENSEPAAKTNPIRGSVVLSGSCSIATNDQVATYRQIAPSLEIDMGQCMENSNYSEQVANWVLSHQNHAFAPLVYATVSPDKLNEIQSKYGAKEASFQIEALFASTTQHLKNSGVNTFIVAGGETSGIVTQQLEVSTLRVSHEIAPGVPWVVTTDGMYNIALKSGNFGDTDFFAHAQELLNV
ncbi:3-oxo-tetronate kinase [Vibrio maritimus]|uniref:3-oxo-tetronate kinase n=1 Tax=Vibrio maritimus TaxID=990268 RepID=UPI003736466C